MSRYFEIISVEEFKNKIGSLSVEELIKQTGTDIKVKFDLENISDDGTFGPEGLVGYHSFENGLTFLGIAAGGDWEQPVFFIFYFDGKKIRGYVPTLGNPWNTTTKQAYGNDELSDTKNAKKRWPNRYKHLEKNEFVYRDDFDFSPKEIKKDILDRIKKR